MFLQVLFYLINSVTVSLLFPFLKFISKNYNQQSKSQLLDIRTHVHGEPEKSRRKASETETTCFCLPITGKRLTNVQTV